MSSTKWSVKEDTHAIAPNRIQDPKRHQRFASRRQATYPKAVAGLRDDLLLTCFRYGNRHRQVRIYGRRLEILLMRVFSFPYGLDCRPSGKLLSI